MSSETKSSFFVEEASPRNERQEDPRRQYNQLRPQKSSSSNSFSYLFVLALYFSSLSINGTRQSDYFLTCVFNYKVTKWMLFNI